MEPVEGVDRPLDDVHRQVEEFRERMDCRSQLVQERIAVFTQRWDRLETNRSEDIRQARRELLSIIPSASWIGDAARAAALGGSRED